MTVNPQDYANIDLAPLIDHSLLSPSAIGLQVEQFCNEVPPNYTKPLKRQNLGRRSWM